MGNKVTVVMYHYVRELYNSRYPDIKGLDFNLFKEQLLYLKKNYNFVKMRDVIDAIEEGEELPSNPVILTFDDAYKDHFDYVFPILDEMQIQGCFYVPVKAIKNNKVLNVNKIHFILATQPNKDLIIKDIFGMLDEYRDNYQLDNNEEYFSRLAKPSRFDTKEVIFIKRLLQADLEEELRNIITDRLFNKYVGVEESRFSRELYLNIDQLKCMIRNGMHIGAHGYDHYWLEKYDKATQENQIVQSKNFLESIGVDLNEWTMSYPYGSYNDLTIDLLKKHNCKLAFTTNVDVARTELNKRYELPRLDTNDLPKSANATKNIWLVE